MRRVCVKPRKAPHRWFHVGSHLESSTRVPNVDTHTHTETHIYIYIYIYILVANHGASKTDYIYIYICIYIYILFHLSGEELGAENCRSHKQLI